MSIDHVDCGNARHPDGAWHPAVALPGPGEYVEGLAQRLRRRAYGCGCPHRGRLAYVFGRLVVSTVQQPPGAPLIDEAGTILPGLSSVRAVAIVRPWRLRHHGRHRRRPHLRTDTPEPALVLGWLPRNVLEHEEHRA